VTYVIFAATLLFKLYVCVKNTHSIFERAAQRVAHISNINNNKYVWFWT